MRTPANYDYHTSLLEGSHASADTTAYGIVNRSPLNEIDRFHVANGTLPRDIMHILFEGVLFKEIKLMLYSFIRDHGFFTLHTLNE